MERRKLSINSLRASWERDRIVSDEHWQRAAAADPRCVEIGRF